MRQTKVTPAMVHLRFQQAIATRRANLGRIRGVFAACKQLEIGTTGMGQLQDEALQAEEALERLESEYAVFCRLYPKE